MAIQNSLCLFSKPKFRTNFKTASGTYFRTITNSTKPLTLTSKVPNPILSANKLIQSSSCSLKNFSTTPQVRERTVIDGINLHWKKFGNGPHIVMCLPGLAGSITDNFLPVSKKMNLEKFTLIAWDPPGYGESRPPDREILTEEFCLYTDARLAGKLMKELGYEKYSTLGWSNGGGTGAFIAAISPAAVHRVVMCNTPHKFNTRGINIMEAMVNLDSWTKAQRRALLRTYEKPYALKLLQDWKTLVERISADKEFPTWFAGVMDKVECPVLYIRSKGDIVSTLDEAEDFGRLIKNYKLHIVPKGGHDHLEFLDEFVSLSEEFLLAEC